MAGTITRPKQWIEVSDRIATRVVRAVQVLFLLIALPGLNNPFLSVHFERQNQTYDIARQVFEKGWQGILVPRASFSLAGYSDLPFTVARLEFPFYGFLGWPFAVAFGHDRAVVRLIAVAFSLLSIYLMFHILRHWLDPLSSVTGAALWAFAPLVMHFGQAPMPDILCTTGWMSAFYCALRRRLKLSSAAFAFAVLAKESVVPLGLPVLVALLVAKGIQNRRAAARTALVWCALPTALLTAWLSLDFFGPKTPWTVLQTANDSSRGPISELLSAHFYVESIACLLPYGLGVIGSFALYFAAICKRRSIDGRAKLSMIFAGFFYWIFVARKILEPQYFLPLLCLLVICASFGFAGMRDKMRSSARWRAFGVPALALHILTAYLFTSDLKASRVPDYPAIERAARHIPPGARVAIVGKTYGASPAVWLNRNVEATSEEPADLARDLPYLESMNFRYLMILDLESRHSRPSAQVISVPVMVASVKRLLINHTGEADDVLTHYCDPGSPTRRYCDAHFKRLFESRFAVLYALPAVSD
jgi:hypothetical protein